MSITMVRRRSCRTKSRWKLRASCRRLTPSGPRELDAKPGDIIGRPLMPETAIRGLAFVLDYPKRAKERGA